MLAALGVVKDDITKIIFTISLTMGGGEIYVRCFETNVIWKSEVNENVAIDLVLGLGERIEGRKNYHINHFSVSLSSLSSLIFNIHSLCIFIII